MNLSLTAEQKRKLQIDEVEADKIRLAARAEIKDINSCQTVNSNLSDALSIIGEKLAVADGKVQTIDKKIKDTTKEYMKRLVRAKNEAKAKDSAKAANERAKAAWESGGKNGEFEQPYDMSVFEDISDITTVDPSKLTDVGMKSIAEAKANSDHLIDDYYDYLEASIILDRLQTTIIQIGKRINDQIISFGVQKNLTGGRGER